MNKARFARLPKEVQDIIVEVGREYEARTGTVNEEDYPKQMQQLRGNGATGDPWADAEKVATIPGETAYALARRSGCQVPG